MIPHRLNLLSPEKRQYLRKMIIVQFSKNVLDIILIFISLSGMVLLGGRWVLEDYYSQITSHIISNNEKYRETNQAIKDINTTLAKVEKIQTEYIAWSPLLTDLFQVIPENINLTRFNIDAEQNLYLDGTSPDRQSLFNLKENLEQLDWLKEFVIPPDQLVAKEKIKFNFFIKTKL